MDIESRLQKIEAQVHQTRRLVRIVLALVLVIGLGLLLIAIKLGLLQARMLVEYIEVILAVLVLIALVCLLAFYLPASIIVGLRQFRASHEADAQVFREAIAGQAKTRGQDPNP